MPSFILRDIDPDFWATVKSKAALEQRRVKDLLYDLLRDWLKSPVRKP